jgi:putative two-component system response regulator
VKWQPNEARILVVDDEPANLKLLERMLGGAGYYDLELVEDAPAAVDSYRRRSADLILLDIGMPRLDGFSVMEQLKALDDPLLPPILVLTAQHGRDCLLRALQSGARDFIRKPFDVAELLARVRNLLDVRFAHRRACEQAFVLEGMVRERTAELRDTRLQVVQRLGRAAEYRDNETGNHILRMSHSSALMARYLGWNEEQCELLLHASPMHDIGKIGIPDHILLRPGPLTPAEWEIMKSHTTIGAHILEGDASDLLRCAREIALCHHEKWDGSGYPRGLANDTIPLPGRIVALADVFDALISVRPYKRAWTVEAAVAHIQAEAGRHFDPLIVDAFLACLPEILAISRRFAEPGVGVAPGPGGR